MTNPLNRFDPVNDQKKLDKYPEKDRNEMIFLAVTRNSRMKVLHWRIAWQATDKDTDALVGYKVLEVKHEGNSSGAPQTFQFRFSLRDEASNSSKEWVNYDLGYLPREYREILVSTAADWEFNGEGNCIACVRETIESLVDISAFGVGDNAKKVLQQLRLARKEDIDTGVPLFVDLHIQANAALETKRAEPGYKSNVLKAYEELLR